jgi:hypothetical protein
MLHSVLAHLRAQWMGALALALVIGGGTAYAANTIGSSDVIDESLQSVDVKNGEIGSQDLKNNATQGVDVRDGSLTGKDVGQAQFVNFTGSIGIINANSCSHKKVTGLPVDNKDHLVLTPSVTTAERDLIYTPVFDVSETRDMFIKVCNPTEAPIDGATTNFNLLVIDAD